MKIIIVGGGTAGDTVTVTVAVEGTIEQGQSPNLQ